MKLFYYGTLMYCALAKAPRKAGDLEEMSEDEREDLDQKLFEFNSVDDVSMTHML